jgi:hypothetical protein
LSFSWAGNVLGQVSIQTRLNADQAARLGRPQLDAAQGRFIRVAQHGTGVMRVEEVYAWDDYSPALPTTYPTAVAPIGSNPDFFQATVWRAGRNAYGSIRVPGKLLYGGGDYDYTIGQGAGGQDWQVEQGTSTSTGQTGSTSSGFEVETTVGAGVKLTPVELAVEIGYLHGEEEAQDTEITSSIGTSFNLWGRYGGLDTSDIHPDDPNDDIQPASQLRGTHEVHLRHPPDLLQQEGPDQLRGGVFNSVRLIHGAARRCRRAASRLGLQQLR